MTSIFPEIPLYMYQNQDGAKVLVGSTESGEYGIKQQTIYGDVSFVFENTFDDAQMAQDWLDRVADQEGWRFVGKQTKQDWS